MSIGNGLGRDCGLNRRRMNLCNEFLDLAKKFLKIILKHAINTKIS